LDKGRNVVLVFLASGHRLAHIAQNRLEVTILLRANLLQDVGEEVLDFFGLGVSGDNEEVFTDRELD
jgi:hypothetical protein